MKRDPMSLMNKPRAHSTLKKLEKMELWGWENLNDGRQARQGGQLRDWANVQNALKRTRPGSCCGQ